MNIPLLHKIAQLIEMMFRRDAPDIEKAAVAAAINAVESDPKVQAVQESAAAMIAAAHDLKAAIDAPTQEEPPSAA